MSHTRKNKAQLLNRVRRIGGQVEAVERALLDEVECAKVMQLVASVRGAMNGLMAELIEEHVRNHIVAAPEMALEGEGDGHHHDPNEATDELMSVVRAYLK
ncbi:metal/formaldehyde-sensitive transcriptional repressor [Pseudoroseicyclus tamaricis]|uniref:Metal/formaldehyde-sensitive transcriptional repressor n=1 Tax=Pseudoroseicyclus tamaricis TaxID=2705421 RepID=A0A6B2JQ73_9RHOB|nr:metal/formaldehyde-sensitive transcriptional repressor [Pseudoroseicyclus tamaricis]NDV00278.1 metal/formaldehyde-sensitive transcriptional repressor [Pseudoroseicyclus tamaricis]